MQLIDTHAHLDFPEFEGDLEKLIERAQEAGVVRVITPGANIESSRKVVELAARFAAIFAAVGIHPHEADKIDIEKDLSLLRRLAVESDKVVAIGEIGLDYYKGYSEKENQKKLFKACLKLAGELELAVILHNRQAHDDFLSILKELKAYGIKGVVHCFSGDEGFLEKILSLGMYVSFTGSVTFENAGNLREIAKHLPPERLLLETDSPYMAPEPHRGKRNESAYIRYLLDTYAGLYNLTPEDIARITTHNANHLFRLSLEEKAAVAYGIRNSLYLNITNRCTNRCTFCTREFSHYVKGHNLKLNREPTGTEVIEAMGDISKYREVVFCGYGEPTLRLNVIKSAGRYIKEKGGRVRLVTNGEGSLINGRDIAPELKGIVDAVSVSINAPDAHSYDSLCYSVFGKDAYAAILDFIGRCRREGIDTELTCLDSVGGRNIEKCRAIAEDMGANFRLRKFNVVG